MVSEPQLLLFYFWSIPLQTYTFLVKLIIRNQTECQGNTNEWLTVLRDPQLLNSSMDLIWKLLFEHLCVCLVPECCPIISFSRHSWIGPEWIPSSSKDSQELWPRHSCGSKWRKQDLHISAEAHQRLVALHQGWGAHGKQLTAEEQLFSETDMLILDFVQPPLAICKIPPNALMVLHIFSSEEPRWLCPKVHFQVHSVP